MPFLSLCHWRQYHHGHRRNHCCYNLPVIWRLMVIRRHEKLLTVSNSVDTAHQILPQITHKTLPYNNCRQFSSWCVIRKWSDFSRLVWKSNRKFSRKFWKGHALLWKTTEQDRNRTQAGFTFFIDHHRAQGKQTEGPYHNSNNRRNLMPLRATRPQVK